MILKNDREEGILSVEIAHFSTCKDAIRLLFIGDIEYYYDIDRDDNGKYRSAGFSGYVSESLKRDLNFRCHTIEGFILDYILMVLFIKYAKVEIKYLPAGQKVKGIDCKYVNDTKEDIRLLDSTWFTTLVKSDAFKVRGHFRLQPKKKDGEWTKELIWISDFEKHGYTRKAGILKEESALTT